MTPAVMMMMMMATKSDIDKSRDPVGVFISVTQQPRRTFVVTISECANNLNNAIGKNNYKTGNDNRPS